MSLTPDKLAKSNTEHAHQVALFAYCAIAYNHGFKVADSWAKTGEISGPSEPVEALEWFHAIPNGGARGDSSKSRMIRGAQLKAEGVKSGVPDCFLPYSVGMWHGLYIEMKKPSQKPKTNKGKGGLSEHQIKFKKYAKKTCFGYVVCYTWIEAANVLRQYLEWKE